MSDKPKVKYNAPDDLKTIFADNLGVIFTSDRLYLNFFEAEVPVELPEGKEVSIEKSKCVARIVLTPQGMQTVVNAMQKGLESYRNSLTKADSE